MLLVQFVLVVLDTILPVGTDQPYLLHTDVDIPCPLVVLNPIQSLQWLQRTQDTNSSRGLPGMGYTCGSLSRRRRGSVAALSAYIP